MYNETKEVIIVPHGLVIRCKGKMYTSGTRLPKGSKVEYVSDEKVAKAAGIEKKPAAPKKDGV